MSGSVEPFVCFNLFLMLVCTVISSLASEPPRMVFGILLACLANLIFYELLERPSK